MDKGPVVTGQRSAGSSGFGNSHSVTNHQTLSDMALTTPTVTPDTGATTPGIQATTPCIQATTPGVGFITPGIGGTTPCVGFITPGIGGTAPGIGGTTPGIGGTTPGTGGTTPGTGDPTTGTGDTEASATIKVLEALTAASVAEAAVVSATAQAKQDEEHSSPQFPSDQDKRKKNRQTTKLKSVLSSEPHGRHNVPQEEDFLRAVEAGDVPSVRRMLRNKPGLDVNCTDLLGRTPLRIAVQNENQEIVEILLDRAGIRNMYESLLLAISLDQESIALCILRHPMYTKVEQQTCLYSNDNIFLSSNSEDSLFEAETTPLILAAQRNSYEVLSLLLDKGFKIEEPHDVSCDCNHCKAMSSRDDLRYAKSRLNAYRGLTSEAYICLSSPDPILSAFNLRRKLKKVARNEKHYRDEYETLQKKLGQYVVRILDCVRGDEELDVLLNMGVNGNYELLGRLNLAIRYDEKKFVAHSSCQKKLTTMWYGQLLEYMNRSPTWARPIFVAVSGIMFPFSSLVYFFAPTPKVRAFMHTPVIKFIHQSSSFFVFLLLICCFSLTVQPSHTETKSDEIRVDPVKEELHRLNLTRAGIAWSDQYREYEPPAILIVLNVFVVGMIWQECKQMYASGPKDYFSSMFNLMDTFSLSLYVTSFALRYTSYFKTYQAHTFLESAPGVKALIAGEERALYWYYWMYADRYYWDAFDPIVVAEGLFALANVVSFSRLFYLLAANEQLGPLQISLRSMIGDISRFMAIFIIICVAFMVGLNNLYWYYEPGVRGVVELPTHEPVVTEAEEAFGTIEKTFTTVFWSIFGMGESSVVRLGEGFAGDFTERVGYIVFGLYNVAIVIILMNMLIAMMSMSFEAIVDDQDIEWKFARAQLYMDFVQGGCTLPVPFNVIPTPKTLYRLGAALCGRCKKQQQPPQQLNNVRHLQANGVDEPDYTVLRDKLTNMDSVSSKSTVCQSEEKGEVSGTESTVKKIQHLGQMLYKQKQENTSAPTTSFTIVMKRLVKRYIFESERVDNSPLEGDIDELKQDLSGLRFELNNLISQHQRKSNNSIQLLTTKLDFLISVMVSKKGEAPAPPMAARSARTGLHNAVHLINSSHQFQTKSKAKSRLNRFSPHHVSVTDEGTKRDESVEAAGNTTPDNVTQVQHSKENHGRRARAVFNNRTHQLLQNRMAQRGQGNETSNGSGLQPQVDVENSGLKVPPHHAVQRSNSYREVDVDSMEVTVLDEESDSETDTTDKTDSSLEESFHFEEEEESSRYASSSDQQRGRPHHSTTSRGRTYSATHSVNHAHQFNSLKSALPPRGSEWQSTPTEQYTAYRQQHTNHAAPGRYDENGRDPKEKEEEVQEGEEQGEMYDYVNREGHNVHNEGDREAYRDRYSQNQWTESGEHGYTMEDSSDTSINAATAGQDQDPHRRLYHHNYVNEAYEDDWS